MRSAIIGSLGLLSTSTMSSLCRKITPIDAPKTCLPLLISGMSRAVFTSAFIETASRTSARGLAENERSNGASYDRSPMGDVLESSVLIPMRT